MAICHDGEGVTKTIEIQVTEAASHKAARQFAHTLATSPLVKTAIFGADPNWGRIIAALGRSGYSLRPDRIVIAFNQLTIVKDGQGFRTTHRTTDSKSHATAIVHYCRIIGNGKRDSHTMDN